MSSPPPYNRYMEHEPVPVIVPPGFPSHQPDFRGAHPGWYNRYIRAWTHWGCKVIPHEKSLWIETAKQLRPPKESTRKVYNHLLGKNIKDDNFDQTMSWAVVVAVMSNQRFFPEVIESCWMKRARKKFPHATALRGVTDYWEQLPLISKEEAQPRAFETPTTATQIPSTPAAQSPTTPRNLGDEGTPTPAPRPNHAATDAPFASIEEENAECKKLQKRFRLRWIKGSVKSSRKAYLDG